MSTNSNIYDSKPWLANYAAGVTHDISAPAYSSLIDLFNQADQAFSSHIAYTCCLDNGFSASLTFKEIKELSDAFASFLQHECNLKKGDAVAIQMPNCLPYPIAAFGVLKAGGVLVNTNPLYTEREMEHQFTDSNTKVLIIMDMFMDKLPNILHKTQIKHVVQASVVDLFPAFQRYLVQAILKIKKKVPHHSVKSINFKQALKKGQQWPFDSIGAIKNTSNSDLAALQYTGGTTGVSKGAMLTHGNLVANVRQLQTYSVKYLIPGQEVILTALPLYHIFAFTVNGLLMYSMGARNILAPSPRPISNLRKAFEKFNITWITGVNTLFNGLVNEKWFQENPPRNLKVCIAGGMALQKIVADKWKAITGTIVGEGYGLSETSPVLTFGPFGGHIKENSIGLPVPETVLMCVDENLNLVPANVPGEIAARGPQVMIGYWNRPEETEKSLKNGMFLTGDIGLMDNDGYFKIVDRKKDMVLVSGFNVFPNEVEEILASHPGVLEAAVIGIPDENTGEQVKAFVTLKNKNTTEKELRDFCKGLLAAYKVPKSIVVRDELPKTPVGKILRKELRESESRVKN